MNRHDVLVWISVAWFASLCVGATFLFVHMCGAA